MSNPDNVFLPIIYLILLIIAVSSIQRGIQLIRRGYYRWDKAEYRRMLFDMDFLNILRGRPEQTKITREQRKWYGILSLGLGVFCLLGVVYAIVRALR